MSDGLVLSATSAVVALLALIIERLAGYPDRLYAALRHPVVWIGALISWLDDHLNPAAGKRNAGRMAGLAALLLVLAATLLVTLPLALGLRLLPGGFVIEALLASSLLSQTSLGRFVTAVADRLAHGLDAGRDAVRHIVGRDPQVLDESGVARAAIESLAENTSDGITAPLFWLALGGLPAAALYKTINTADSMIGHRDERHLLFGWAAARLDDLVNLPAARLTGILFALAAAGRHPGGFRSAMRAMGRDAHRHGSPNAGWPEAAMAGALGVRLGGPRSYDGEMIDLPAMGDGRDALDARDIGAGLAVYHRALLLLVAITALWALALWLAT